MVLCPDFAFLHKVVLPFHLSQYTVLSVFFLEFADGQYTLHSLDIEESTPSRLKGSAFSTRSKFVHFQFKTHHRSLNNPSKPSMWISATISLCYHLAGQPLLENSWAHSTCSVSTPMAFLAGKFIEDICAAVTFASHYTLDV